MKGLPNRNGEVPRVTVLMCVYNGEAHLAAAIESVLAQTWREFEFLIINDASTDGSRQVCASYHDPRIRLIDNERNLGLTRSLNRGLALAMGTYLARLDADDVSAPQRLERQISYFQAHPRCALLFTGFRKSTGYLGIPPADAVEQRWRMLFDNPMGHSTVMFRREVILNALGGYDESFPVAQDYALWTRALERGLVIGALPEVLVHLEHHERSISSTQGLRRQGYAERLSCRAIQDLCPTLEPRMIQVLSRIWAQRGTAGEVLRRPGDLRRLRRAVKTLIAAFAARHGLSQAWQDDKALEFARRVCTDVWHSQRQGWGGGLLCEILAGLTLNFHRPPFQLRLGRHLGRHLLGKLRQRRRGHTPPQWRRVAAEVDTSSSSRTLSENPAMRVA
ncbi:MAG: glycosyltransferase family 2 protein [Candidatus Tectomicrobia bacterium]|nr:glycosyltransferase family 2 protein [Candidatus Tectomicrobia bacterium]